MSDIAEAFGPKYKNNRLKKLFTVKGREVHGISDFFRDDDVFIGVGNDSLTEGDIQDIIEELYPDSPYARNLLRDLEKQRKKRQAALKDSEADKRDSGFGEGSDGSNRDQDGDYIIYKGRSYDWTLLLFRRILTLFLGLAPLRTIVTTFGFSGTCSECER
jgi:doublecortin-like kinase 3